MVGAASSLGFAASSLGSVASSLTFLQTLWFVLICVLWAGYFVLEGFDFGVGMLVRSLGRDDAEKRALIHTIGPVWDGNEVWLIVAGGATFAAFPGWYASLFSGFYLPLLLILLALIVRGVSFEFWGKREGRRWRSGWEWVMAIGSLLAALLWGVAWANIVAGVPMNASHDVTATIWDLLHPYALLGGLAALALMASHGAIFLTLRTRGELVARSRAAARLLAPAAAVPVAGFLIWTAIDQSGAGAGVKVSATVIAALAVLCALAAAALSAGRRDGLAFAASAGAIVALFASLFVWLAPNALPSSTSHAFDLTLAAASSSSYTLTVMSIVTVVLLPVVLAYQAWTYWVFRHRLGSEAFAAAVARPTPLSAIEDARRRRAGGADGGPGTAGGGQDPRSGPSAPGPGAA